jgi:hypothetical protein
MEKIEVELFANISNSPVIKMPGRHYPGVVIQGDSLANLYSQALTLSQLCVRPDDKESDLYFEFKILLDKLAGYLINYSAALTAHNLDSPFTNMIRHTNSDNTPE